MSDVEKQRMTEQRVVWERQREASRPYYQFIYQISKERERIQAEFTDGEGADKADINTQAYENIKNTWTKRAIWNVRWGILPGMFWKHERPLDEEARGAPMRNFLGPPHATNLPAVGLSLQSTSPVESRHRRASGATSPPQQGPSAGIASAALENGDAGHSPSRSISPRRRSGTRALRPIMGQVLRPSKSKLSQKDGQLPSASLGPVHSSKVSKAAGKKRPGPRRGLNFSQTVSSRGLISSSGVDVAKAQPFLDPVPPRRSKRINALVPSLAQDLAKMAYTHTSKRTVRPKPERNVAGNLTTRSSAKPQGILKRKFAKATLGKAKYQ
ncbi:MAG: hypothetical protein M1829_003861 [Trizodia sp. TS-e1964]|nr:MAG: hypothetical protein M1829_003861 [Trizodia sp. TS-e1964]